MYNSVLLNTLLIAITCYGQSLSKPMKNNEIQQSLQTNAKHVDSETANHRFLSDQGRRHKRSDDIPALQTVVQDLSQQLSQVKAQLNALDVTSQQQYAQLKGKLDAIQTRNVAFHAHHSTDPFNIAAHDTLVYDTATTNIGGGYDPQSGIFTVPYPGTYAFFVNCMALDHPGEELRLVVNGQSTASCYSSKSTGEDPYEQGATVSVVHLLAGQKALVKSISGTARDIRGSLWNSFAGLLVHADV